MVLNYNWGRKKDGRMNCPQQRMGAQERWAHVLSSTANEGTREMGACMALSNNMGAQEMNA